MTPRYFYFLLLGLALVTASCRTTGTTVKSNQSAENTTGDIDEKSKTKIDYFYVEATTQQVLGNFKEAISLYIEILELDPKHHASMYNIARISMELRDYESAEKYARQAANLDQSNYWYYDLLVQVYEGRNMTDKAIATAEEMSRLFEDKLDPWLLLSDLYFDKKQYRKSIEALDHVEEMTGISEEVVFRKFRLYDMLEETEAAKAEIEKLIDNNPFDTRYYEVMYDYQTKLGNKEGAMDALEHILDISPDDGFALLALADYYKAEGQLEKSDEYLFRAFRNQSLELEAKMQIVGNLLMMAQHDESIRDRIRSLTNILYEVHQADPMVILLKGDLLRLDGKADSAAVYYRMSLEQNPVNEKAWRELLILESEEGEFDALFKDGEKAIEYFPNDPTLLYFFALGGQQTGNLTEAVYAYEKIKKIGTTNLDLLVQVYSSLGELYFRQKKYDKSNENYDLVLELQPDNHVILNNYAYYLSVRNADLEKAEKMSGKSLKLNPGSAIYMDTYGWILYQMGDFKKSEEWLKKAVEKGGDPEIFEHYGDVQFKLGNKELAVEYWRKAKKMGSTSIELDDKLNTTKLNE